MKTWKQNLVVTLAVLSFISIAWAKAKVEEGQSIELTNLASTEQGQAWTLNANEGTSDQPIAVWNRLGTGLSDDHRWIVFNNNKPGVVGLVLHYHSEQPIHAFTWQVRKIFVQCGPTNQDQFFIGWTTKPVPASGQGTIDPAQFTAVKDLTLSGHINQTLERPNFSVKDIDTQDVYIFIGRNDINAKGDSHNIFFKITSSHAQEDRLRSFFRIDK